MSTRYNVAQMMARVVIAVVIVLTMGVWGTLQVGASGIPVGPGVTYFAPEAIIPSGARLTRQTPFFTAVSATTGQQAVHVVRIARDNPYVQLQASLARDRVGGLESVLSQALRQHAPESRPRQTVVAAVNADFFASAPVLGMPIGVHVQAGEVVTSPADRPAFGVLANKEPIIGVPQLRAAVWRNDGPVGSMYKGDVLHPDEADVVMSAPIDTINRSQGGLTLYTPRFGPQTPVLEGTAVTVRGVIGAPDADAIRMGLVARIENFPEKNGQRATIPSDGVVFAAQGASQQFLEGLTIGEWLHFAVELAPPFSDVVDAVAGWPVLLQGGERQPLSAGNPLVSGRHPRTAIGFNEDELIIVTADGRQPGYASGMTLFELTDLLVSLGATDAINLDGGGSTTFVLRPPGAPDPVVANVPSDGHERSVTNALLVISTAPIGPLATLHVQPAAPAVLRGAALPVAVAGQDRYGNPVGPILDAITWRWESEDPARHDPSPDEAAKPVVQGATGYTFLSGSTGAATGRLVATVGPVQGSAVLDIVDTVATLQPTADVVNLASGETTAITVLAYDQSGRRVWISPEQLQWTVRHPYRKLMPGATLLPFTAALSEPGSPPQAAVTPIGAAPQTAGATLPTMRTTVDSPGVGVDAVNGASAKAGAEIPVIATIDGEGRVTGQNSGRTTVYARLGDAVAATEILVDPPPVVLADFSADDARDKWFASVVRAQAGLTQAPPPEPLRPGRDGLRFVYDLRSGSGGTAAAYLQAVTPIPISDRPEAIGVWVYGRHNGHWLRGNYIDGTGARQVLDFTAAGGLDWTGWRFVTASVPSDAVLPIKLERLYVVEVEPERQSRGELHFDRVVALYKVP